MPIFTHGEQYVVAYETVGVGVRATMNPHHFHKEGGMGELWTLELTYTWYIKGIDAKAEVFESREWPKMDLNSLRELEHWFYNISRKNAYLTPDWSRRFLQTAMMRCALEVLEKYKKWQRDDPNRLEEAQGP